MKPLPDDEHRHLSVCICTYKRPALLKRLLESLRDQVTGGKFTFSIVVADNDYAESGGPVVREFESSSSIRVKYCVAPRQNIALARNKAVENAEGEFIAFIDDDEFPIKEWLLLLFEAIQTNDVSGVLGPVRPHFDDQPPRWVLEGGFYDRPMYPSGRRLAWNECRTGNVLLRRELFAHEGPPFRPECLTGEDQDFFRRMMEKRHAFVWCNEALVYEVVPPTRWERSFMVRRALFRGVFSCRNRRSSPLPVAKSLALVPIYIVALPIAFVSGQAAFMKCVFNLAYHVGRLVAVVGINPIKQPYVTG